MSGVYCQQFVKSDRVQVGPRCIDCMAVHYQNRHYGILNYLFHVSIPECARIDPMPEDGSESGPVLAHYGVLLFTGLLITRISE